MWEGIFVEENAYVRLDESDFLNAKTALFFEQNFNTYSTWITKCNFVNNNIGIVLGMRNFSEGVIFTPQAFYDNVFEGGNLISPLNGQISFAGIFVYRSPNCIIGSYSSVNTFKNSLYGVWASSSSVSVNGCSFSNMQVQNKIGGYGIHSNNNFMGVVQSSFSDNSIGGIVTQHTKTLLVFGNCNFTEQESYGIYSFSNAQPGHFWIVGNTFLMNKSDDISAIYHERIPGGSANNSNWIRGNTVVVSTQPPKDREVIAIDVYAPNGGNDPFFIEDNYVGVNNGSTPIHGIYIRNHSSNLNVFNNDVHFLNGFTPQEIIGNLGIAVENVIGTGNKINDNDISSSFFPTATPEERTSYIKCGIHLANSPDFQVCSNTVDDTYRAFHLAGNLDFCDFAVNTIGRHYHGLHCIAWGGGATTLGQQNWHENVWSTSASDYEGFAANYGDGDPLFIFNVDETVSPSHMPPSINVDEWFFDMLTDESTSNCVNLGARSPEINDSDEKVMDETYPVESAAGLWDLERELLLKLLTHPELMPAESDAKDWYDYQENSSPWKFAMAAKAYRDAFIFPENLQTLLDSLYAGHKETWDYVLKLDSLQRVDPYTLDSAILQNQLTALSELEVLQDAIEEALEDCKVFTEAGLETALEWNDELPTSTLYEENLKNIYLIDIKAAMGDSLTEDHYDILRGIASQCILDGGKSVRIAPYRLPHEEAVAYLGEEIVEENCELEERQQTLQASSARNIEVLTRPNPANDFLTVMPSEAISGTWEIYNLTGELVQQGNIPANSFSFSVPLGDIIGGIYFLRLTDNGARQSSFRKFIVIH
ncbi:MAG: hypothetical protein OHK0019_11350 [Saprospiraceae bacterium]